jgi:hypothetical protein
MRCLRESGAACANAPVNRFSHKNLPECGSLCCFLLTGACQTRNSGFGMCESDSRHDVRGARIGAYNNRRTVHGPQPRSGEDHPIAQQPWRQRIRKRDDEAGDMQSSACRVSASFACAHAVYLSQCPARGNFGSPSRIGSHVVSRRSPHCVCAQPLQVECIPFTDRSQICP